LSAKGADVKLIFIMRKILLFLVLFLTTTMVMGQIKVTTNGNVGIGTNSVVHNKVKLQITSDGADITIGPNDSGSNIGSSLSQIDFWYPPFGNNSPKWNKIRSNGHTVMSDSSAKKDIQSIENATATLKQIKTYSYLFKSDFAEENKKDYGVLAQEIEKILPELVDTARGAMLVNYNAFIGILIKGFNEQQTVIETQQSEIKTLQSIVFSQEKEVIELRKTVTELQKLVLGCCGTPKGDSPQLPDELKESENQSPQLPQTPILSQEKAILYQNTPNPFSSNTEVTCYLPENTKQAVIYIYNLQGAELKSYSLTQTGINTITVYGSELPAGMYLYTLVVDNEIIDTKRMILTK